MSIRDLDLLRDSVWERFFVEKCGLEFDTGFSYSSAKYHPYHNRGALTREMLESNLDEIIDEIIGFTDFVSNPNLRPRDTKYNGYWVHSLDDIYIAYQILGLLILQTGSFLPKIVEDSIIKSTEWDYDKSRGWSAAIKDKRKQNLESFRNAIKTHKIGRITPISF